MWSFSLLEITSISSSKSKVLQNSNKKESNRKLKSKNRTKQLTFSNNENNRNRKKSTNLCKMTSMKNFEFLLQEEDNFKNIIKKLKTYILEADKINKFQKMLNDYFFVTISLIILHQILFVCFTIFISTVNNYQNKTLFGVLLHILIVMSYSIFIVATFEASVNVLNQVSFEVQFIKVINALFLLESL